MLGAWLPGWATLAWGVGEGPSLLKDLLWTLGTFGMRPMVPVIEHKPWMLEALSLRPRVPHRGALCVSGAQMGALPEDMGLQQLY